MGYQINTNRSINISETFDRTKKASLSSEISRDKVFVFFRFLVLRNFAKVPCTGFGVGPHDAWKGRFEGAVTPCGLAHPPGLQPRESVGPKHEDVPVDDGGVSVSDQSAPAVSSTVPVGSLLKRDSTPSGDPPDVAVGEKISESVGKLQATSALPLSLSRGQTTGLIFG